MFIVREIVGWALIGLGLIAFGITYFGFLRNGLIFQSAPMAFIGFIIFRGGIHLVKVAVAARMCREMSELPKPKAPRIESVRRPLPGQRGTVPPPLPLVPADRGSR